MPKNSDHVKWLNEQYDMYPPGVAPPESARSLAERCNKDCRTRTPSNRALGIKGDMIEPSVVAGHMANRLKADRNMPRHQKFSQLEYDMMKGAFDDCRNPCIGSKIILAHRGGMGKKRMNGWFEEQSRKLPNELKQIPIRRNNTHHAKIMWRQYEEDPEGYVTKLENGLINPVNGAPVNTTEARLRIIALQRPAFLYKTTPAYMKIPVAQRQRRPYSTLNSRDPNLRNVTRTAAFETIQRNVNRHFNRQEQSHQLNRHGENPGNSSESRESSHGLPVYSEVDDGSYGDMRYGGMPPGGMRYSGTQGGRMHRLQDMDETQYSPRRVARQPTLGKNTNTPWTASSVSPHYLFGKRAADAVEKSAQRNPRDNLAMASERIAEFKPSSFMNPSQLRISNNPPSHVQFVQSRQPKITGATASSSRNRPAQRPHAQRATDLRLTIPLPTLPRYHKLNSLSVDDFRLKQRRALGGLSENQQNQQRPALVAPSGERVLAKKRKYDSMENTLESNGKKRQRPAIIAAVMKPRSREPTQRISTPRRREQSRPAPVLSYTSPDTSTGITQEPEGNINIPDFKPSHLKTPIDSIRPHPGSYDTPFYHQGFYEANKCYNADDAVPTGLGIHTPQQHNVNPDWAQLSAELLENEFWSEQQGLSDFFAESFSPFGEPQLLDIDLTLLWDKYPSTNFEPGEENSEQDGNLLDDFNADDDRGFLGSNVQGGLSITTPETLQTSEEQIARVATKNDGPSNGADEVANKTAAKNGETEVYTSNGSITAPGDNDVVHAVSDDGLLDNFTFAAPNSITNLPTNGNLEDFSSLLDLEL
ncbi:hypothetical protein ACMFMG_004071 [Clarireedia jacksonii]